MPASSDRPLRLFVSFAPEDRELKDELLKHLAVLQRIGKIEPWSVDRVRAGGNWRREVETALAQADMALLLLSADFLASDFVQDVEVPKLFERRVNEGLHVTPFVLRTCPWKFHPWIGELKPLPLTGKALAAHWGDERDQALTDLAIKMAEIAADVSSRVPEQAEQEHGSSKVPWIPLTRQSSGGNVTCISYQFSAKPVDSLRPTKTDLQKALQRSAPVFDGGFLGLVERGPKPLLLDKPKTTADKNLIWREKYDEANLQRIELAELLMKPLNPVDKLRSPCWRDHNDNVASVRGERLLYATTKAVTIAYEHAMAYKDGTLLADFGLMAFDLCRFIDVALIAISSLSQNRPTQVVFAASLVTPRGTVLAQFSYLAPPANGRAATFGGGFAGGKSAQVLASSSRDIKILAEAVNTMLNGIASEFVLEAPSPRQPWCRFLSIPDWSIERFVRDMWPPLPVVRSF